MGCCVSSPHARRRYVDPADFDEEWVSEDDHLPLRTFGKFRGNQVIVPDDIDGLPSTRNDNRLATNPHLLLYEAEIDNGKAWRCFRPLMALVPLCPPLALQCLLIGGCTCDEICCWVRKEYSTRTYYRVYPNRIEINDPGVRIPWGCFGCGSWNADKVIAHPFDRGAFGFHRVQCGVCTLLLCYVPTFGDVIARQRCQCNGPVWHGGWWCDEWICNMMCCTYRYDGLADGDEVAFASNLALQAYFEGRKISAEDMEKCLEYWRQNASEYHDPVKRKRDVMCEPYCSVPCCLTLCLYENICQCRRKIPFKDEQTTPELREVYDKYERLRERQVERYAKFKDPVRLSTCCQAVGCRRFFGRKGLIFCTEGCNDNKAIGCCYKDLKREGDDPFPPPSHPDIDDNCHAAHVLQRVLGDPPRNVVYKQWEWDSAAKKYIVATHCATQPKHQERKEPSIPIETSSQHSNTQNKSEVPSPTIATGTAPTSQNEIDPLKAPTSASNCSIEASLTTGIQPNDAPLSETTSVAEPVPSTSLYKGDF